MSCGLRRYAPDSLQRCASAWVHPVFYTHWATLRRCSCTLLCLVGGGHVNGFCHVSCISAAYTVVRCLSVRPSVCLSVTCVYCVETSKHILKPFLPSDGHIILVFSCHSLLQCVDGDHPNGRRRWMQVECNKSWFSASVYLAISRNWYKITPWLLWSVLLSCSSWAKSPT